MTLDDYLKRMNPQIPALIDDLELLADGLRHLRRRAPGARARPCATASKTGNTLVEKRGEAERASSTTSPAFSNTTETFLDDNGNNIIRLGELGQPQLAGAARRYSPEFPCLLEGIVDAGPAPGRGLPRLQLPHQPRDAAQPAARLRPQRRAGATATTAARTAPACRTRRSQANPGGQPARTSTTASTSRRQGHAAMGYAAPTGFDMTSRLRRHAAERRFINALLAPAIGVPRRRGPRHRHAAARGPWPRGTEVSVR